MRLLTTAISVGLLFAGTAAARADILFNTLGGANQIAHNLTTHEAAESFVADSTNLGEVQVDLAAASGASGSIVISIATDNGNAPGSITDIVYSIAASSVPTSETLYDFNNLPVSDLTAGSKYWLVISSGSGIVDLSTSAPSTGVATTQVVSNATDYWRGTISPGITSSLMLACVSSDNSCDAVQTAASAYTFSGAPPTVSTPPAPPTTTADSTDAPEPASVALLAAGLAGLGVVRRRKA